MAIWRLELELTASRARATGRDTSWEPSPRPRRRAIEVRAEPGTPTSELDAEIRRVLDVPEEIGPLYVGTTPLCGSDTIADAGLRHGDVITDRPVDPDGGAPCSPNGRHLVVVTGPDAGRILPLPDGRTTVGRATTNDVVLRDSLVSAHHLIIETGADGQVMVTDRGSTNGTTIEAEEVTDATEWRPTHLLRAGSTVLARCTTTGQEQITVGAGEEPGAGGASLAVARSFRIPARELPTRLTPPTSSPPMSEDRLAWWRSLTPLLTGIGFAAMTGRWQFLLIVALAPVVFAIESVRSRRRRAREHAEAAAVEASERESFAQLVAGLRQEEVTEYRRRRPGGSATWTMTGRGRHLWERRPDHDDFATLTIGLAALPSRLDAGDADPVRGNPTLPLAPVGADLHHCGAVTVIGPQRRRRAVLRSWILELVATHGPDELRLWGLFEEDAAPEWEHLRWLPHIWDRESSAGIAVDVAGRRTVVAHLRRLIESRLDAPGRANPAGGPRPGATHPDPGRMVPVHIIVVDGPSAVQASDLAHLLERGPAVGVYGLIADQHHLPDGCGAALHLDDASPHGRYESESRAPLHGVLVAETPVDVAAAAVRRLAPLTPVASANDPDVSIDLVQQLGWPGAGDVTPDVVADRWARTSPTTAAVVGTSGDTPFVVDLAEHGPHGLIGGMSGSGKTEFLMTFLGSLCLNNHPDDLAIVIVDFKGGVDHELTAALPHVVALSTNLAIADFRRTIDLLDAEQRRRQRLLAGTAPDIDTYRRLRADGQELPPLPQLVVVVDEFSELLADQDGRRRLEELVRITRIGRALGVHLLLVTQNFEGQLPPQLDANAGLRVCLRVTKPAHSRAVLGSGVAVELTQAGHAWARLGGSDLVEFRSARVAGGSSPADRPARPPEVRERPLVGMAMAAAERPAAKAPLETTDMAHLVRSMRDAAGRGRPDGGQPPVVPWPGELPESIKLEALLRSSIVDSPAAAGRPAALPAGLLDAPDEQRQIPYAIDLEDSHVLFLGSRRAGTTSAMIAAAVATALGTPFDDLHVFGVDLDGSGLRALSGLPHAGETIAVRDLGHARRILDHLLREASIRRAALVDAGATDVRDLAGDARPPRCLLIVAGADRLLGRAEDGPNPLLEPLRHLVADMAGIGITLWLGGLPGLADSRLGATADLRLVFETPGEVSPAAYGVPRDLVDALSGPGRAVDTRRNRLVQFAELSSDTRQTTEIIGMLGSRLRSLGPPGHRPPPRFPVVTWPVPPAALDTRRPPATMLAPIPLGIDPDDAITRWLDLCEDGPVLAVTGPARSGRSSTLRALAQQARERGMHTIGVQGSRRSLLDPDDQPDSDAFGILCRPEELAAVVARQGCQPDDDLCTLICIDDAHRLGGDAAEALAVAVTGLGAMRQWLLLFSAPIDFVTGRSEVRRSLPEHRGGILLMPTAALDGTSIGITGRLPDSARFPPRPGCGVIAIDGEWHPIRMPMARPSDRTGRSDTARVRPPR